MAFIQRDSHMVKSGISLFRAVYLTAGTFVFFFVLFHIGTAFYVSEISERGRALFQTGIETEMKHLKVQGDSIAEIPGFGEMLLTENSEILIPFLQKERAVRGIGLMGLTNSDGVIISRTKSTDKRGDNVFLTTAYGHVVSQGQYIQTIEAGTLNPNQVLMSTARPVVQGEHMVGALFASHLVDDAYALTFRDKYLPTDTQVAFYTKEYGIYGTSFSDDSLREVLHSYFNSGSSWITEGDSGQTIVFDDNKTYVVENIVFPGIHEDSAGALIFIPRKDISAAANLITAFFTLITFILLAVRYHLKSRGEQGGWQYVVMVCIFALPVFFLTYVILYTQNIGRLRLERVPYTLYNSTLRMQPEWGIFDLGFEQRFTVMADTGDEPINAIHIGLMFDPQAVEIKRFDTGKSSCSYIVENSIDVENGTANFSCVLLGSETVEHLLSVVDVITHPLRTGTFELSFNPATTKVLANDGIGTDVLRMTTSGSYRVGNFNMENDLESISTTTRSFVVFSPSHPNQSRWYGLDTARFVWSGKKGSVYAYTIDNEPETVPNGLKTTHQFNLELPIAGDGIYYFHLRDVSGGPVAHYRLQADSTPPQILSVHASADEIFEGDIVRFTFEADDVGSGIQKNFYIDLGNHLFLPIGQNLFVPFLDEGEQKLTLRVYDGAGNFSEKDQVIRVKKKK